jgi:hypothetical protein
LPFVVFDGHHGALLAAKGAELKLDRHVNSVHSPEFKGIHSLDFTTSVALKTQADPSLISRVHPSDHCIGRHGNSWLGDAFNFVAEKSIHGLGSEVLMAEVLGKRCLTKKVV